MREERLNKKRPKIFKILIILMLIATIIGSIMIALKLLPELKKPEPPKEFKAFLASDIYTVKLYNEQFVEEKEVSRGLEVILIEGNVIQETETEEITKYKKIKYDNAYYLINPDNIVMEEKEIVKEKNIFVKTSTTLYKDLETIDISGFIKKGSELNIIGYDSINEDGSVNRYNVEYKEMTGYIYSKYLVSTKEAATARYDAIYKYHKSRGDSWGGGSAASLDYYPYEKPKFEENVMPENAKTIYLNGGVLDNVDLYISMAKKSGINAFVVDIKENTAPSYPSKIMQTYTKKTYNKAANSWDKYAKTIKKIKDAGFYVIGRITTFKDSFYVSDNPKDAITNKSSGQPLLHNGSTWPSPFVRRVWEYNIKLAIEAVKEFGFNEIQFDYVRFMDRTQSLESQGIVNMKNEYKESKAQAIQNFLRYAADEIHNAGAYVSADVFGETSNTYVTAYGQYWPAISNVVDAISAMPYPDHFEPYAYGLPTPWTEPYKLMRSWAGEAAKRQKEVENPAVARTWIQAYNAIRPPNNTYGPDEIRGQIKGLKESGLNGGFITWLASSNLERYNYIMAGWQ